MPGSLSLYVVVFIGGASVLAVEILGTRILGPFYGVSLFLWSALITVTLAALSVGYVLGGRWADKGPKYSRLAVAMAGAGLWLLVTPWIKRPVLELLEPFGLRMAVLVSSLILFFVPLALLGMISPYAIRLKARRLEEVGRTAGNIYAVSTLASVVAALVTGFVLIPNVGVNRLIVMIGAFLLLGALIALWSGRETSKTAGMTVLFILAAAVVAWKVPIDRADPANGLHAITQSSYAEIRVLDDEGLRHLLIDGGTHSIVDPDTWETHHPYAAALEVTKYLFEDSGDVLLVGLGAGSVAKNFSHSFWKVDAVEIDPVVVRVAREYFGFADEDATVYEMDGRRYLKTNTKKYNYIVLDAFGSSSIPFHLVTREFFALAESRLAENGILAMNLESRGWEGVLVRSVARTLRTHFDHVVALPTQEPEDALGNVLLLASNHKMDFPVQNLPRAEDHLQEPYHHWVVVEMNHAWLNRFEPGEQGAHILTDDLNPADVWAESINLEARSRLHEYFDSTKRSW